MKASHVIFWQRKSRAPRHGRGGVSSRGGGVEGVASEPRGGFRAAQRQLRLLPFLGRVCDAFGRALLLLRAGLGVAEHGGDAARHGGPGRGVRRGGGA